jgi:ADP-heptose:LPS heptosyltransferase
MTFAHPLRPAQPSTAGACFGPSPAGPAIKKIAVFRALQLGDLLCSIPAIRALRHAFPSAQITLLGLPWAAILTQRFPAYINRFIHFPGYPGLPEQEFDSPAFDAFLETVKEAQFDLLLQMQGNGTIVNSLLSGFGARCLAGFHNKESWMDSPWFVEYPEHIHEIHRHQLLVNHLGIPLDGNQLEFPLTSKDEQEFAGLRLPLTPGRYVCLHPGSRGAWRQWPPQYFALLADHCTEKGFDIVLTGTANEADIIREVIARQHYQPIDLTGSTTLGSLGVLLRNAALLIANCTGVSHLAAALRTPSLIISMDGEPHRWGPLDHRLHTTIDWTTHPSPEEIIQALDTLLEPIISNYNIRPYDKAL